MSHPPITAAWVKTTDSAARAQLQAAWGEPVWSVTAKELVDVQSAIAQAHAQSLKGYTVVGYVSYEAAPAFDSALPVVVPEAAQAPGSPEASAPLAHWQAYSDNQIQSVEPEDTETVVWSHPWKDGLGGPWFERSFEQVRDLIEAGEFYQLNLTTRLKSIAPEGLSPWSLFQRLFQAQSAAHSVFLDCGARQILSLSPELFFKWKAGRLETSPMKGTRRPGDLTQLPLQDSGKDRAENVMIVDLLRNDMARVCQPRSVQVRSLFDVLQLPTVEQMTSTLTGRTVEGATLVDVFCALFPCGSVTGAPKRQAMLRIAELEASPRGVYCGAMGVMEPGGAVRMNVPIRTLALEASTATYGVGSGLTWYSDRQAERREWWQKTTFLRAATCDFKVLETLRLDGQHWVRLDGHLARMRQSAHHFGFVWSEAAIRAALAQAAQNTEGTARRGRLLLAANGELDIELSDLPDSPERVHVQLAERPILPNADWIGHKTTNRSNYDAFSPTRAGVFDTLLFDPKGYLTETCRFNLVFQMESSLFTPARAQSGPANLLNGVFRSHLLSENVVTETTLSVGDLARVERAWLVNSLREWVEIDLISSPQEKSLYVRQPSDSLKMTQQKREAS